MKVSERKGLLDPKIGGPGPVRPDGGAVAPAGPPTIDQVSVSDAARELARLRAEVGDVDTVRVAKVEGLSAVMAKGQYSADVRDVARKVLRHVLGELVA
jgi:anti-sigma28 factor (negative regulator of flagellin synthesis)